MTLYPVATLAKINFHYERHMSSIWNYLVASGDRL